MYVCVPCVCLVSTKTRRQLDANSAGVTDDCEPPCGYWEQPWSSARAVSAINCLSISPDSRFLVIKMQGEKTKTVISKDIRASSLAFTFAGSVLPHPHHQGWLFCVAQA